MIGVYTYARARVTLAWFSTTRATLEVALEWPDGHGNEFPEMGQGPTGLKMGTHQNVAIYEICK